MEQVRVLGAGPAGGAAALAALGAGAAVEIYEKSIFPRHKVCGEFLSPDSASLLDRLGVWSRLRDVAAPMRRILLTFGERERRAALPETAWGLSRKRLDAVLLDEACKRGAVLHRETGHPGPQSTVVATGRRSMERKGQRLFGFKAHFTGKSSDTVELYFFGRQAYLGISPVEDGFLNVCGIAPESLLARFGFSIDNLLAAEPVLSRRLRCLARAWPWLYVGPVTFRPPASEPLVPGQYRCGDALGFVDPFTGSGILSALLTGTLAGQAAARGKTTTGYAEQCRHQLSRAYTVSRLFRTVLTNGWAHYFVPWVPVEWLFTLTRPSL